MTSTSCPSSKHGLIRWRRGRSRSRAVVPLIGPSRCGIILIAVIESSEVGARSKRLPSAVGKEFAKEPLQPCRRQQAPEMLVLLSRRAFIAAVNERIAWLSENRPEEQLDNFSLACGGCENVLSNFRKGSRSSGRMLGTSCGCGCFLFGCHTSSTTVTRLWAALPRTPTY